MKSCAKSGKRIEPDGRAAQLTVIGSSQKWV